MTTLKSFQAEIESISHEKQKIAIKEAREAHAAAELARHHGKLPRKEQVVELKVDEDEEKERSLEVSQSCRCICFPTPTLPVTVSNMTDGDVNSFRSS